MGTKSWSGFVLSVGLLFLFPSIGLADKLDRLISPITNPVNFEDPRIHTEIRPIFIYHEFDNNFVTGGGDTQIYALQARAALSDRFALIATKDGYVDFNPDDNLDSKTGFANITLGAKYGLFKDARAGTVASGTVRYEIPSGDDDVFHGEGGGFFQPTLSGATIYGPLNLMAGTGFRIPTDNDDSLYYDLDWHVSMPFERVVPVVEFNLVHVLDAGDRIALPDEGMDFFPFGSSGAENKTLLTGAVGSRVKLSEVVDLGVAYQFPLTGGSGSNVIDWRLTTDLVFRLG